jgi:hypothetical protein
MALRTHNLSSRLLKKDIVEVDEVMYQGIQRPCELIFCILGVEKIDLEEVA